MELKWVDENVIEPFKDREVDLNKTVDVYRCLNRSGKVYSIKQGGKVIGHTSKLKLIDATFVIQKAGQEKCKVTGTNNPHALVRGKIDTLPLNGTQHMNKVTYDPYNDDTYVCHTTGEPFEIHHATSVNFTEKGVFVVPID